MTDVDVGVSGRPVGIPYQDEKRSAAGLRWVNMTYGNDHYTTGIYPRLVLFFNPTVYSLRPLLL